jgi:hypothetical protein
MAEAPGPIPLDRDVTLLQPPICNQRRRLRRGSRTPGD